MKFRSCLRIYRFEKYNIDLIGCFLYFSVETSERRQCRLFCFKNVNLDYRFLNCNLFLSSAGDRDTRWRIPPHRLRAKLQSGALFLMNVKENYHCKYNKKNNLLGRLCHSNRT
ncbi:unnamed protein product, partial [Amoebophrya sp. A120]|eukprot:GSA120T00014585001.1